jgi:hypothetical protein
MTEDRAREVLAGQMYAAGYRRSAEALREGSFNTLTTPAFNAMLAYAAEAVKAERAKWELMDVAIVRAVLHAYQRSMAPPDSGWGDMSYAKGSYDHLPGFKAALTAIREARDVE